MTVCHIVRKLETDSCCDGGNVAEEVCRGVRQLDRLLRYEMQ